MTRILYQSLPPSYAKFIFIFNCLSIFNKADNSSTKPPHTATSAQLYFKNRVHNNKEKHMFRWAIIFAVIALVASLLGFGGVAGLSKQFAIILLIVAVILAIVGFLSRGKV
jgi:uncharacterized membrane protein YtjA (UPF0391 family)